jgi:hypothetical protein
VPRGAHSFMTSVSRRLAGLDMAAGGGGGARAGARPGRKARAAEFFRARAAADDATSAPVPSIQLSNLLQLRLSIHLNCRFWRKKCPVRRHHLLLLVWTARALPLRDWAACATPRVPHPPTETRQRRQMRFTS